VTGLGPEDVQHSFDEAVAGNLDRLVALFSADVEWRGLEHGRWFWRKAPS
jgi:ketosteroid isomerase-like protein